MKIATMVSVLVLVPLLPACGADPADFGMDDGTAAQALDVAAAGVGQRLFEDVTLSVYGNQSCQTCHQPGQGFSAPLAVVNQMGSVVEGSVPGRFGNRRPPTSAYATMTPTSSIWSAITTCTPSTATTPST